MKILLTGSSSCIGGYVLKQLDSNPQVEELVCVSRKYESYYGNLPTDQRVKRVECHLDKHQWTDRLLSEFKPTHIVHIAGNGSQQAAPRQTYTDNLITTVNLLDKIPKGTTFVFLSSVVCGSPAKNVYTLAKSSAEILVKLYHEQNRINGRIVRTCAITGFGAKHGLLPDLVNKLPSPYNPITLLGSYPGSRKPFVYAGELAEFIIEQMLLSTPDFTVDSFGPIDSITVADVAKITMEELYMYKTLSWDCIDRLDDQRCVFMPFGTVISKSTSGEAIKRALRDIMKGTYGE